MAGERHGMCESALNLPEPSGPHRPVMGMLYLLLLFNKIVHFTMATTELMRLGVIVFVIVESVNIIEKRRHC
jgi:hypothetical protein